MADEQPATSREAQETARVLAAGRTYIETLPATERAIAEMAANGAPVWEIAQSRQITPEVHRAQRSLINRLKWAVSYFLVAVADYRISRRLNFGADGPEA